MRSHSGIKPFLCSHESCGKRFSEKGNLKTHMRIHTGEKPYSCNYVGCDKRFSTQGHLIDHVRSHSDVKPFPCSLCSKAFMRASTLKVHMRDHTGERPYRCTICSKNFKEGRSLRAHLKVHGKQNEKVVCKPVGEHGPSVSNILENNRETSSNKSDLSANYNELACFEKQVSTILSEDFDNPKLVPSSMNTTLFTVDYKPQPVVKHATNDMFDLNSCLLRQSIDPENNKIISLLGDSSKCQNLNVNTSNTYMVVNSNPMLDKY